MEITFINIKTLKKFLLPTKSKVTGDIYDDFTVCRWRERQPGNRDSKNVQNLTNTVTNVGVLNWLDFKVEI